MIDYYPDRSDVLAAVEPVYETLPGLADRSVDDPRESGELPEAAAKAFLALVEAAGRRARQRRRCRRRTRRLPALDRLMSRPHLRPRSGPVVDRSSSPNSARFDAVSELVWIGTVPAVRNRTRTSRVVGRAMIPRYSTPEMTAVWSDTSKWSRYLEVELLATEAHAEIGVVPADDAAACRRARTGRRRRVRRGDPRPRGDHRPRRRRVRRRRPGGDHRGRRRRRRQVDPLRADVVRRRRHGAVLADDRRRRRADRRSPASCSATLIDLAERAPRHGDDRSHPRSARRTDDVRGQGWRCGRCRSTATGPGCAPHARRSP